MPTTYKLFAPEASFRAFAPLIAAEFCGVDVDVSTDTSAAAKSPTGKLPILECAVVADDGDREVHIIFSSSAIAKYVAGLRGDAGLLGNGSVAEAAQVDFWVDFASQRLELPSCVWFYPVAGYMPYNKQAYVFPRLFLMHSFEAF